MMQFEARTEDDMRESGWSENEISERLEDQDLRPTLYGLSRISENE